MRNTGKDLACSTVGRRSSIQFQAGPEDFVGPILLCISVSGWHTTPVARQDGLVLEHFPFTNAASQWLYVNLVCRFHIHLGRFSPVACLVSSGLITYVCAAAVTQRHLENPVG